MFGNSGFGQQQQQQQQQQSQQNSLFGQQQPQNNSFGGTGGFGATSTPSAFGGTNAFGQTAQTAGFGASTPAVGGFGATTGTGFGQARPAAFSFGASTQQQQQQPSVATTSAFGGFGSTSAAATPAFGGSNTTGGNTLFGQPATVRPTSFGTVSTNTAFGGSTGTPAAGGSVGNAFGAPIQSSAFGSGGGFGTGATTDASNRGTAVVDFAPIQERDTATSVNNYYQTITSMPQYRNFSLEELRLQDYTQNRKSSGTAPTGSFGTTNTPSATFGNPTSGFGQSAFGQQQQQQQQQPSPFGQTTNTGFGTMGATTFAGQQQQQQTPFGGATAGGFGFAPSAATPFGGQAFPGGNTLFGQQANPAPGFGQPAQQQKTGFGGFGTTSAPTTSAPMAGGFGGFGASTASQPTAAGGFGAGAAQQQQPMGGGFGVGTGRFGTPASKPTTPFSFAAPAQQPASSGGLSFGATNAVIGGFGTNQAAASSTGLSGFGTGQAGTFGTGFGGFGAAQQQQQQQQQQLGNFGTTGAGGLTSFGTNAVMGNQQQQPMFATVDKSPFGQSSVNDANVRASTSTGPSAIPLENQKKYSSPHFPTSPQVASKIKLRGFALSPSYSPSAKKLSALETLSDDAVLSGEAFSKHATNKKLVFDGGISAAEVASLVNRKSDKSKVLFDPKLELVAASNQHRLNGPINDEIVEKTHSSVSDEKNSTLAPVSIPAFTLAAVKEGYYSTPSFDALTAMTKEDLKHVSKFVVGRQGYGQVQFAVPVDLSQTDLQMIMGGLVVITERQIVVYPDQNTKPDEGRGLNVPAIARLENCFTYDKNTKQPIRDPEHPRFKLFVEKLKTRPTAEFVDYDENTGSWAFKVKHF